MMDRFVYLKPGVALILVFVGGKMARERVAARSDPVASLGVILLMLARGGRRSRCVRSAREARAAA